MTAAIWAELPEAWLSTQPILFYVYIRQFAPRLFFLLGKSAGQKRVEGFNVGVTGYGSVSSPLSLLVGGGKSSAGPKRD